MSEPVTEIVECSLAPGVDISTGEHQEIWHSTLQTIKSQSGCVSVHWGHGIENPETVHMAIDWENLAAHKTFEAQPYYQPFLAKLAPLISSGPRIHHIALPASTPFADPGSAPVTECIALFFASGYTPSTYDPNFNKFRDLALQASKEARGIAGAWSIETVKHDDWKAEHGEEGPTFSAFIGWPSVKAHMDFRETEDFKTVIPPLRDGPKGLKVWHVSFNKFE